MVTSLSALLNGVGPDDAQETHKRTVPTAFNAQTDPVGGVLEGKV